MFHRRHRTSLCQCLLHLFHPRGAPHGIPSVPFHRQDLRLLQLSLKFLATARNPILFLLYSSRAPLSSRQLGRQEVLHQHHFMHPSLPPRLPPSLRLARPVLSCRLRLRCHPSHPQAIAVPDWGRSCPFLLPVPLFVRPAGVIWSVLTHWPVSRDDPVPLVVFLGKHAGEIS